MTTIHDLYDLAQYVGAYRCDRTETLDDVVSSIGRRLYKDTACGIGFAYHAPALRTAAPVQRMDRGSVSVAGYCEGTDGACADHTLAFPFTAAAFDAAVEAADRDGCDLWDDTHGCEACAEHYGVPVEDGVPVHPCSVWTACPSCEGHGIAL
jgi:hypothetical protein